MTFSEATTVHQAMGTPNILSNVKKNNELGGWLVWYKYNYLEKYYSHISMFFLKKKKKSTL